MADHALRLGPYKRIRSRYKFHMDRVGYMQCGNQIQKKQENPKKSDTQVPRPDMRIAVEEKQQSKQRKRQHWLERVHYCNFFSFVPWTGQATKYSFWRVPLEMRENLSSGPEWKRSTHRAVCAWQHRLPPFHCSMWRPQIKVSSRAWTFKMARGSQVLRPSRKKNNF